MNKYDDMYRKLVTNILSNGIDVYNERTGKTCRTLINVDFEYDSLPLITLRRTYWRQAVAELIGYLSGFDSAAQFRAIGCKTWDANANENTSWLKNPHRKGEDDMGRVYGVQGRDWINQNQDSLDQLRKIYDNLSKGIDDRGEILTFWNPGEFGMGCLRPCMYSHHFSLLGDTLYLNSTQRSCDVPLGLTFNMVQPWVLLLLMARVTGYKVGKVFHKIVNAHIYQDQIEPMLELLQQRSSQPHTDYEMQIEDSDADDLFDAILSKDADSIIEQDPVSYFNVENYDPNYINLDIPFSV